MIRTARTWAALGAAGALTVGALAVPAFAQEDAPTQSQTETAPDEKPSKEERRAEVDAALADELGVTVEELTDARKAARATVFLAHLDEQVEAGRLTQEEADELRAAAEDGTLEEALKARALARLEEKLDEAVAEGRLTQEEADEKLQAAEDGELPRRGRKGGRGGHHGGRGGPAAEAEAEPTGFDA